MNEKNYKILILFGGVSSEHDISCISAASVMKNIDIEKYDVTAIGITKDGKWMLTEALPEELESGEWSGIRTNKDAFVSLWKLLGTIPLRVLYLFSDFFYIEDRKSVV